MTKVTIRNEFHQTSVNVIVPENGELSIHQSRRIRRELCGMDDCNCGTVRGDQDGYSVGEQYNKWGEFVFSVVDQLSTAQRTRMEEIERGDAEVL